MQRVVATIGVFDGVHRGHALLFEAVRRTALALGAVPAVVGFDPHPVEVLAPTAPPRRLTPRVTQTRLFAEFGIERAWFLPFSTAWAALSPVEFVDELTSRFDLAHLWIGHDFRFGRDRSGDIFLLAAEGGRRGFVVEQHPALKDDERVVSSTWVREALAAGDLETVERLTNRSFFTDARVVGGRGEGSKVLVPTANLEFASRQCLPGRGVYTCWAETAGKLWPAVANVGCRPTLTRDVRETVEVHLIDARVDLLGRRLGVYWGRRLREERKFEGLQALREAVFGDIDLARVWHQGRNPS